MRQKISRRKFITTITGAVAGTLVAATGYVAFNDESDDPVVTRVELPIKNLKPGQEGFTIAVLADFHLYPYTQLDLVRRAVQMANDLKPNLTVLLGDYVWHDVDAIFDLAPALAHLNAQHGVFSIIGNHDIWTNVEIVRAGLTKAGIPILTNQGLNLPVGGDTLYLAGLDDGWSGHPDLNATMAGYQPNTPVVLLMHEPDLADEYSQDARISVQLSGHSHGGQIRFPGVGALVLPYLGWKYDLGLYRVNEMWLYTNGGIGVTNEPVRFNCPPEITEIVLVRA
jgi:predicted MPP superfamily phosphohydrolase